MCDGQVKRFFDDKSGAPLGGATRPTIEVRVTRLVSAYWNVGGVAAFGRDLVSTSKSRFSMIFQFFLQTSCALGGGEERKGGGGLGCQKI